MSFSTNIDTSTAKHAPVRVIIKERVSLIDLHLLQEKIKAVFDPKHILNPGKIFPADAKRFHGAC